MNHSNKQILKYSLINAALTSLYIAFIGSLFHFGPLILNSQGKPDTVFAPIAMLLLYVVSASITGSLVLGRPLLWYLDGSKKEAVTLFMYTLASLLLITVIAFSIVAIF